MQATNRNAHGDGICKYEKGDNVYKLDWNPAALSGLYSFPSRETKYSDVSSATEYLLQRVFNSWADRHNLLNLNHWVRFLSFEIDRLELVVDQPRYSPCERLIGHDEYKDLLQDLRSTNTCH